MSILPDEAEVLATVKGMSIDDALDYLTAMRDMAGIAPYYSRTGEAEIFDGLGDLHIYFDKLHFEGEMTDEQRKRWGAI